MMNAALSFTRAHVSRGVLFCAAMLALLLLTPRFSDGQVTQSSFTSVLGVVADNAPIALAVGLGIVVGQFDLSVLASYGLGATLALQSGWGPYSGVVMVMVVGAVIGLVQGLLIARLGVNAVAVSLGAFLAIAGAVSAISKGKSVVFNDFDTTIWLITPKVWAITPAAFLVAIAFLVVGALMRFTRFGQQMRAVGGDAAAARISGVRNSLVIVLTLALAGAVAAGGGALHGYSTSAAAPTVTFAPLITAITAIVVGGMSLEGGRGKAGQVFLGVLSMALFSQALAVAAVDPTIIGLVTGIFLVVVAALTPQLRDWARTLVPRTWRLHGDTTVPASMPATEG